jgi:hypothetical protein
MADLAADEEVLVRIEGIEILTEYLTCIKKDLFENDYLPNVEKILKKAIDPITADEIRIRVAKLSGKILDGYSNFGLAIKHQEMFIEFLTSAL